MTERFSATDPAPVCAALIRKRLVAGVIAACIALWLWQARAGRGDNFVAYLPGARQLIPVQTLDHTRYVPLLKLLNLVGTVSSVEEKRHSLKVWMGTSRLDLHEGDRKLKLDRHNIQLGSPVRVADGEWLVPLDFISDVLSKLTAATIHYRPGDERVFIGDVKLLTFSTRLSPAPDGARLTVQFSDPVTVKTASTNGQWVIFLGDKALQPLESETQFQDRYVSAVAFDDHDGVPKLVITPGASGLNFYPNLSADGRTFQADVTLPTAPPPASAAQAGKSPSGNAEGQPGSGRGATGSSSSAAGVGQTAASGTKPAPPAPPLPVVVLDAGHGGQDAGARSRDGVSERDLAAALAERIRASLTAAGKVRVILTRQGSSDPTLDERDVMANEARPAAFLSFHAGDLGGAQPAVEIYTYQSPSGPAPLAVARGLFTPWQDAQWAHLDRSRYLAGLLAQQLARVSGLQTRNPNEAPVRQLRSIDAPAVAIELGTLAPRQDGATLTGAPLQTQIADAVAQALAALLQGAA